MKGAKNLEASVDNISKDELIMEVKRAKSGDKEAFCNLVRVNKIAIYRVAKSILNNEDDIEDAVSEAVLKAYKNIKNLRDESFFKTWLIRIVINESNNLYKKRTKEIAVDKEHFKNIKNKDNAISKESKDNHEQKKHCGSFQHFSFLLTVFNVPAILS